jgi:DNA (cytosine-5)-methyltransferase 1
MEKNKIKVGSDFSGVGAFNQALKRLGVNYEEIFACDMDKYARQTFIHNYGEPKYYPTNVYDREIPTDSLDIYMTSPPCQAFSLAGKRLGKEDKRGILFFNSYEFIQINKPRYFIFENVKGLLSDDEGKTFQEWVNMLGGKSVNGVPIIFPYEESVPYHLYWKVLNAKDYGVPQNRERVFLIGIRDDEDNNFRFPLEETLTKRLKDVLEADVDDKYFLSEKMINVLSHHKNPIIDNQTPEKSATIHAGYFKMGGRDQQYLKIGTWRTHEDGKGFREVSDGNCPTIPARAREDGSGQPVIQIKLATSKGHKEATEGDSVNLSAPNSKTRRGRVGKGVAQTLDTGCQQAVILGYTRDSKGKVVSRNIWEQAGTIHTSSGSGGNTDQFVMTINEEQSQETEDNVSIGALRGRVEKNEEEQSGNYNQKLEINNQGTSNTITSVQKDNLVVYNDKRLNETIAKNELPDGKPMMLDTYNKSVHEECPTLKARHAQNNDRRLWTGCEIRRLTPRECFRLMDFPDTFTWPVSDSQAYKQAGNSIVVNVLYKILKSLNL